MKRQKPTHKQRFTEKHPYIVVLPADAKAPTDSIYQRFNIVSQTRVLWSLLDSRVIRCSEPFTLEFLTTVRGKQKVRQVTSKFKPNGI